MRKMRKGFLLMVLITFFVSAPLFFSYGYGIEPVRSHNGMVASTNKIASRVGIDTLRKGGSAVDAAVAIGFTLAVVHPQAGNIGGGGFMMIRTKEGNVYALDYREKAPLAADKNMFIKDDGTYDKERILCGYLAVGVPGTVKGFWEAHKKHGKLEWRELIEPAVKLARDGFPVSFSFAEALNKKVKYFREFPSSRHFVSKRSGGWQAGDLLIQRDLADTLERIAEGEADEFYRGTTAQRLVSAVQKGGGIITLDDLRKYNVVWRRPLRMEFHGYTVYGMPPPSSGGITMMQVLKILQRFPLEKAGYGSAEYYHLLAEAMKRAYRDRALYLGDPDFSEIPVTKLLSDNYIARLAEGIKLNRSTPSSELAPQNLIPGESDDTTHFSVIDSEGNAVSNTYTLNSNFGSKAVAEGTGILLNNEMDDFAAGPGIANQFGLVGIKANFIEPEKRMLSSMAPTIIVKEGDYLIAVGAPGGGKIISTVLQVILNISIAEMNLTEAILQPRIHHQWIPDEIRTERFCLAPEVLKKMKEMGHEIVVKSYMGAVQIVKYSFGESIYYGSSDPRKEGEAVGY